MKKIYATTLNPESFDYRVYDIREDDGNLLYIDGGKEWFDIDNTGYLAKIKKLINAYNSWDYEYSYHEKMKDFLEDYLPNKENGKKLSPREIHYIKLSMYEYSEAICACLRVITGINYKSRELRGSMQREWVRAYYPEDADEYANYVEAWFFGTGIEVMVHDEESEPKSADEIYGYTFYTEKYRTDDIKKEVIKQTGYKEDEVEIILWEYDHTETYHKDFYKLAD